MIVYWKSHRRQPVRMDPGSFLADPQSLVPYGWCTHCGGEVYDNGAQYCVRCLSEKGKQV